MESLSFEGISDIDVEEIEGAAKSYGVHRRIGLAFLSQSFEDLVKDMNREKSDLLLETIEYMEVYKKHLIGMIEMTQKVNMRLAVAVMFYADQEKNETLLSRVDNLIENIEIGDPIGDGRFVDVVQSIDNAPPKVKSYRFRLGFSSTDGKRGVGLGNFSSFAAAKAGIPYYHAWLERNCELFFESGPGQWEIVKELYFDID